MADGHNMSSRVDPAAGDAGEARIILCERSGRWAVAIRRELGPAARLLETRSVPECWACLARSPESLVVVEVTAGNLKSLLARMSRREREYPRARIAVVASRSLARHEWLMREAGAVMFLTSPRRAATLAALARRHLAAQTVCPVDVIDAIWRSLPWKRR